MYTTCQSTREEEVMKSKYFKRKEFACKCGCGFSTVDAELLQVLEEAREDLGPIVISCGARCPEHNAAVGGADGSKHKLGLAADIYVVGNRVPHEEVQEYFLNKYPNQYGIGRYNTFTHIDVRPEGPARWDFR